MRFAFAGVLLLSLLSAESHAAEPCEPVVGRIASLDGRIEVQRDGSSLWQRAALEDVLCQGDTVRAAEHSRAALALINETVLRIDQNTAVRLTDIAEQEEENSFLSLISGAFQAFSRKPRQLEVDTPYLNGAIEGTEFVFRVTENRTLLTVLEGRVRAANDQGSLVIGAGEALAAQAGQAPQPIIVVKPRDAVQWALYYPPLLAAPGGAADPDLSDTPRPLSEAIRLAGRGDTAGAFDALERVPATGRDARFYLYRAALLLSVGQVAEARSGIDRALAADPGNGLAFALKAVINVVQNERQQALADANQALSLSPDTAAARIALSYVQQAGFQLAAARDTLLQAVERQPQDPLAWARLSELWLMLGNRSRAVEAAEKATALAPGLARAQVTLGFAALAEFRSAEARAAFERAIALQSADPLAHLGAGLAKISTGDLAAGRQDLEVAVALDSNNALLRAYLGKAYFEEKRFPLDAEQYAIAKTLDPLDPTALLYDGILKQTLNRPIEALRDLETSIALNDNRAVYRSRLLLDEDRAARGTSLARVYKDLGFDQLGINEATESLAIDPSNASAHRFLSDSYRGVRRRDTARVSELLQAQLMQDININPVQPSVSETNLNIVTLGGPASPGFNEFTPLFEQNQVQFNATGVLGNNDTYGGEAVVSGLYDRFSWSAGAFSYDTAGWRANNDLEQEIYNVYAQAAITPVLNMQAEFSHRESNAGDLAFNFDPDDFLVDKSVKLDRDSARVGLRYSPTPRSQILLSYIYSEIDEIRSQSQEDSLDPLVTQSIDFDSSTEGYLAEGQYIYQGDRFNLVAGAAHSDSKTDIDESISLTHIDFGPIFSVDISTKEEIEQSRAYFYTNIHLTSSLIWTLGASYDDFTDEPVDETSFNPKLGVQWRPTDAFMLRAAAFKVVKPSLINNRTLEPTQVAGFNQLFDDPSGTQSWRYGIGFEWRLNQNLSWGAETTWRDLEEPITVFSETGEEAVFEERKEQLHKIYFNWTPRDQWSLAGELVYDRYESEDGISTEFGNRPEKVETISMPVSVTYFNPSGLFASIAGTYVDQDVDRSDFATQAQGHDSFFVVDAAVGYRFAKRRGIVSLGIKNLFDTEFKYQDDSFREFSEDASTGPYFPERIILGRMTFSF